MRELRGHERFNTFMPIVDHLFTYALMISKTAQHYHGVRFEALLRQLSGDASLRC